MGDDLHGFHETRAQKAHLHQGHLRLRLHRLHGFHPQLTFRVFVPDDRKAGGSYRSVTDAVKKVDIISRKLVLMGTEGRGRVNKTIDFDRIAAIHGALVDYMDDGIE